MKTVTIFEGPDGGGKTTLAKAFARKIQATLVHHGSYLDTPGTELAAIYAHGLDYAIRGVCHVVMDRCWLSEKPYGMVMRGHARLSVHDEMALEARVFQTYRPVVVLCLPPVETCLESFRSRPAEEYLKKEAQLRAIHVAYQNLWTMLPVVPYDRTKDDREEFVNALVRMRGVTP